MADTPIKAIVQRGLVIYLKDADDSLNHMCEAADFEHASWIAFSLAGFHEVPHEVEDAEEPALTAVLQISGNLSDPEFQSLIKFLQSGASYPQGPDRQITDVERRAAAEKVLEGQALHDQASASMSAG